MKRRKKKYWVHREGLVRQEMGWPGGKLWGKKGK